ncbi:MAG: carboxypeptidase-like regulatory domain-containing protein [Elusimicrobia bacterium]|nr:carboxypeptidase-like regulatory domain-containing protein [Elusimicrobiota bacterium]
MQNLAKCPGCQSEITPTETSCPVCLRPRSRSEIMHDIIAAREIRGRRRMKLLLKLLLSAAVLWAGYRAYANPQSLAAFRDRILASAHWLTEERAIPGSIVPGSPPAPQAPADAAEAEPMAAAPVAADDAAEAEPMAAAPGLGTAPPPHAAKPARPDHWKAHGVAYDLFSLKPVVGAKVTFTSRASGLSLRAATGPRGDYSLRIPRADEGGFDVTVRHKDYRGEYLEEDSRPYRSRSRGERQEAAALLLQTEVLHVPLLPPEAQDESQYDLVLLPVRM